MLFSSYTFLFVFLPVAWLVHGLVRRFLPKQAIGVLVLASLLFYGWWDPRFLALLLASVGLNFAIGRKLAAVRSRGDHPRLLLRLGITLNLACLGFFKYADFFLENVGAVSGTQVSLLDITLPIGISFYTFQQIAYLVDVADGKVAQYGVLDYTLFVSFFPQLIAGPIVHHSEMMPQFEGSRGPRSSDVARGLTLMFAGLFKKVVIADNLAPYASSVYAAADAGLQITSVEAWAATLAYTMQIYFDFSGYSDMAIGLARLFGIHLPLNFNSPYKATSIIDFWRRWHMTLSRFLRDYLYIPLGGNRNGRVRRHVNLMLTMVFGGLWHGAGWGFVIWGALHGAYLVLNHAYRVAVDRFDGGGAVLNPPRPRPIAAGVTFLAVTVAWVFFRATTLDGALEIAGAMFGVGGFSVPSDFVRHLGSVPAQLGLVSDHTGVFAVRQWATAGVPLIALSSGIALFAPNTSQIFLADDPYYQRDIEQLPPRPRTRWLRWRPVPGHAALAVALFVGFLLCATSSSEFLYFQF